MSGRGRLAGRAFGFLRPNAELTGRRRLDAGPGGQPLALRLNDQLGGTVFTKYWCKPAALIHAAAYMLAVLLGSFGLRCRVASGVAELARSNDIVRSACSAVSACNEMLSRTSEVRCLREPDASLAAERRWISFPDRGLAVVAAVLLSARTHHSLLGNAIVHIELRWLMESRIADCQEAGTEGKRSIGTSVADRELGCHAS